MFLGEDYNVIDDLSHPVVAGVPSPFWGSWASHDIFTNLPGNAHVIVHGQNSSAPTMVEYGIGNGWMIAYGQTLEITYDLGWQGGPILPNAIFFGYNWSGLFDIPWLTENPLSGTLLPGEFADIVVTFNSTGLPEGDYFGGLSVDSNDPFMPQVIVPVQLTVQIPPPIIQVNAPPLHSTQSPDSQNSIGMQICNIGGSLLHWEITEISPLLNGSMPFVPVTVEPTGGLPEGMMVSSSSAKIGTPEKLLHPEAVLWD